MNESRHSILNGTCLVTVTYGERFALLKQVLEAAFAEGIRQAVVVDNGCPRPVSGQLGQLPEAVREGLTLVRHETNLGSAGGFASGLTQAAALPGCRHLWLLDDDNKPTPGSLGRLQEGYQELRTHHEAADLAVLSLRPDRLYLKHTAQRGTPAGSFPPYSSFLGFHLKDLAAKIRRHAGNPATGAKGGAAKPPPHIQIPYGPYGGLFFHVELLEKIGPPRAEMYLYGDDTEFTCRLSSGEGKLFLLPASQLEDIDVSWMQTARGGNSFTRYLNASSDRRVYFSVRNQVHVERRYWTRNNFMYLLNRQAYLLVLWMLASKCGAAERRRWQLIKRAAAAGRSNSWDDSSDLTELLRT